MSSADCKYEVIHQGWLLKPPPGRKTINLKKMKKRYFQILHLHRMDFEKIFDGAAKQDTNDKKFPEKGNYVYCLAYWKQYDKYPIRKYYLCL